MVPGCSNNSSKTCNGNIFFHRLPKEPNLANAWIAKTRRQNPPKRDSIQIQLNMIISIYT